MTGLFGVRSGLWRRKRALVLGGLGLAVALVLVLAGRGGQPVETATVTRGTMQDFVETSGRVKADPEETIYAEVVARVEEVLVEAGEHVEAGQVLARLDDRGLALQLEAAQARLDAARARLAQAEAGARGGDIRLAESDLAQARTVEAETRRALARAEALLAAEAISREEYQAAVDALAMARESANAAQARLEMLRAGAAVAELRTLSAQVREAATAVELVRTALVSTEVRARSSAVVLSRLAEPGTLVNPGTAVFKVGDPSHLVVDAQVIEADSRKLAVGQEVLVTGEVLDDRPARGTVSEVAPAAEKILSPLGVEEYRVPIKIRLAGVPPQLRPGFTVDLRIIVAAVEGALMVPREAVFQLEEDAQQRGADEGNYVFLVEGGQAKLRPVAVGLENPDVVQIVAGVAEKDVVVLNPLLSLKDGVRVTAGR